MNKPMPAIFFGHGNPMNALLQNEYSKAWGHRSPEPYDWAVRFEKKARELLMAGDDWPLVDYESLGSDAMLSIPTPDHYLPLLYVTGMRREGERIGFPVQGVDGGSVSMLAVQLG